MRNLLYSLFLCVGFLAVFTTEAAAQKTASVAIYGQSIEILPSQSEFVSGVGNETAYFSTFNGTAGSFLVQSPGGYVSNELRPRSGSPGIYEGAYEIATPLAVIDYGSYALNIPTTDSSGLGIPDVFQFGRAGSFAATGSGYDTYYSGTSFSISFNFSRSSGSAQGTYGATLTSSLGQSTITGPFELDDYQGSMTYVRGSTNVLNLSVISVADSTVSLSGSTAFTVVNSNQVNYAAFTANSSTGTTYSVLAGTLTRLGNTYQGSLQLTDGLPSTSWPDYINYRVAMIDNNNSSGDGIPDFSDPYAVAPTISAQPASQSLNAGGSASFSITASNAQSYQWYFNGVAIAGATSATLSLTSVQLGNAGNYTVTVSNAGGSSTSSNAILAVSSQPIFTLNPVSVTVASGRSAAFSVVAIGSPSPTYQWKLNNAPITGATDAILLVSNTTSASAGTYTCTAANSLGSATSASAILTVTTTSSVGHLINLSTRANVGTGNNLLIGGFVIGGTGTKPLLVRGVGPTLTAPLGGSGELASPQLTLLDVHGLVIASNIAWGNALMTGPSAGSDSPQSATGTLMDSLGAASYAAGSGDTAMVLSAPVGNSTAEVAGVGGTSGIALVEFYDADTAPTPTAHLINISARADVGTGNNILIGGFAVSGATSETVLIRAVGPGLVDSDPVDFSLATVLNQPVLTLLNSSGVAIYSNTVWAGDATLATVFPIVGAFTLNPAHADSALLVTLPAGTYTAEISGLNGGTGIALCEIYEVQ